MERKKNPSAFRTVVGASRKERSLEKVMGISAMLVVKAMELNTANTSGTVKRKSAY